MKLNTPAKRVGLLLLLAGACVVAFGWSQLSSFTSSADCLIGFDRRTGCSSMRWGALLCVVGLAMAAGGYAAAANWIRTGSTRQ